MEFEFYINEQQIVASLSLTDLKSIIYYDITLLDFSRNYLTTRI